MWRKDKDAHGILTRNFGNVNIPHRAFVLFWLDIVVNSVYRDAAQKKTNTETSTRLSCFVCDSCDTASSTRFVGTYPGTSRAPCCTCFKSKREPASILCRPLRTGCKHFSSTSLDTPPNPFSCAIPGKVKSIPSAEGIVGLHRKKGSVEFMVTAMFVEKWNKGDDD